ncbi:MAG: YeiH family protein [Candidatus Amulumruptor caecigallinarius]|nr:YeiH family protein [Candidatus Amulumruptor caecigallinarius]
MKTTSAGRCHGILFMALFACAACYIGEWNLLKSISISPLIIGIILGMAYANSLRNHLPDTWTPGIKYCSKSVLRFGIILYGFRLTFQDVLAVGMPGITIDAIIVLCTILLGVFLGRWLKMDRDTALLTSVGSAICGAAAVLGAEATLNTKPYKTAVAVSTVVIFGTLSMFLYPMAYRAGLLDFTPQQMGIYAGSTLHEVAHAVGAGNAMGEDISKVAIIVKMIRVMMLVAVLLLLGWWVAARSKKTDANSAPGKISVPWFAVWFLVVIGFNSFSLLPQSIVDTINAFDTFLLTMAMAALGAETSFDKFKQAGSKPFLLAGLLYVWLLGGGYLLVRFIA